MTGQLPEVNPALPNVNTGDHAEAVPFAESSQQAAELARSQSYTHHVREARLGQLLDTLPSCEITFTIEEQMRRTYKAGANLATVGYENLRKLIANGFTLPDIAKAIDVDVLDVAYYMAAFDAKGDHMEMDSTLCADSQSAKIAAEMDAMTNPTRESVALAQVKLQLVETRNKRMSDKWAGVDAKAHLTEGTASRIVIHMGQAPEMAKYRDNPRVINSTSRVDKTEDALPLDEDGKLVF